MGSEETSPLDVFLLEDEAFFTPQPLSTTTNLPEQFAPQVVFDYPPIVLPGPTTTQAKPAQETLRELPQGISIDQLSEEYHRKKVLFQSSFPDIVRFVGGLAQVPQLDTKVAYTFASALHDYLARACEEGNLKLVTSLSPWFWWLWYGLHKSPSLLQVAATAGHIDIVRLLAEFKVDGEYIFLPQAGLAAHSSQSLCGENWDPLREGSSDPVFDYQQRWDAEHPLQLAIRHGRQEVIEYFLSLLHYPTLLGCFQEICAKPSTYCVRNAQSLLSSGETVLKRPVNINALDLHGQLPIILAVRKNQWDLIIWLMTSFKGKLAIPNSLLVELLQQFAPPSMVRTCIKEFESCPNRSAIFNWISPRGDRVSHLLIHYWCKYEEHDSLYFSVIGEIWKHIDEPLVENNEGKRWWHIAAESGFCKPLKQLVRQENWKQFFSDIEQQNSPVALAAAAGHGAVVRYLLHKVVDQYGVLQGRPWKLAIEAAIRHNRMDITHALLRRYRSHVARKTHFVSDLPEATSGILIAIVETRNHKLLEQLLVSQNPKLRAITIDKTLGYNALHAACRIGDLEALVKLLHPVNDQKAYLQKQTEDGKLMSCLHFACAQNHQKVVEFLCERGVEHTRDAEGRKPSNLATDNQVMTTCIRYDPELYAGHFRRPFEDLVIFSQDERGEGGYGNTYRGTLSGSPVAVKVLKLGGELYTEVGLLGRASHPNIIRLLCWCENAGRQYIVMELAALSLSYMRDKHFSEITSARRARWLLEIASALSWLHNLKPIIVHGDLRPENIMLSEFDEIKLIDFGLSHLSMAKKPLGNENIRLKGDYVSHPPSDVFAFGVVAVQLFTFLSLSIVDAERTSLQGWRDVFKEKSLAIQAVELMQSDLPPGVVKIVIECLSPQPSARPSATKLVGVLRAELGTEKECSLRKKEQWSGMG